MSTLDDIMTAKEAAERWDWPLLLLDKPAWDIKKLHLDLPLQKPENQQGLGL